MKRATSAILLTALLGSSVVAESLVIFDERSSLGLTLVTTKATPAGTEEVYVGDVCVAAAELSNPSNYTKSIDQKTTTDVTTQKVVFLAAGTTLSILDRGEAGDNIYVDKTPTTPLEVNLVLDPNRVTDCEPARMRVRVRKAMQEWKGRTGKAMQEAKVVGTSVDITVDENGRNLSLADANLDAVLIDDDGLVHAKFTLALPVVTDNKHPDGF